MSDPGSIVVVGGGHAGAQLCAALVAAGHGARLHLVCEENQLPYQRPPLSKTFVKLPNEQLQLHRTSGWFEDAAIQVHLGDPAASLDRAAKTVTLRSGRRLGYDKLVLATGARPRLLPHLAHGLSNVAVLRNAEDAERLRLLLSGSDRLTIVGGGYVGLEVAASARSLGKRVVLLESAPRLLLRSASPQLAEHVLNVHREQGVDVRLGVSVGGFEVEADRLDALAVDHERETVDALLLAIGSTPECELAREAGLVCDNGIVVDPAMRTSDQDVLAIGDCTSFPSALGDFRLRLESVQNANDQAKAAAQTLLGVEAAYCAVPWFWSEQGPLRLQMAGHFPQGVPSQCRRREGATASAYSLLHYVGERLVCVESVNSPADHIAARKLLETGRHPAPEVACDRSKPLKSLL